MFFDLYDRSRSAENRVIVMTANQSVAQGRLRFLAPAKVVLPDGAVAARTAFRPGTAGVDVDVYAVVGARKNWHRLAGRPTEVDQ